jgi:peptidoglycan LD-endopeptidase LytH
VLFGLVYTIVVLMKRILIFLIIVLFIYLVGIWSVYGKVTVNLVLLPIRLTLIASQPADSVLLMPVDGVSISDVADTWQAPRLGGRTHEGQDIFAEKGTKIYSATEGYVVRKGNDRLGGKVITVAGKGNRYYYYAHLDGYPDDIEVGDRVAPESVIGYVGNTGDAENTPSHLHFGRYNLGTAENPLPLLEDGE